MKPVLLTFGACQVQLLRYLLSQSATARALFDIETLADYTGAGDMAQADDAAVARVAIVWEQVVQGQPTDYRTKQRARIPAAARTVRFPPIDLVSLWPLSGSDARRRPEPGYPYARYPFPDGVGAKLAGVELADDDLLALYMELSEKLMPDLDRLHALDVRRLQARDAMSDVQIADWMWATLPRQRPLYAMDHATGPMAVHMTKQLVDATPELAGAAPAIKDEIGQFAARTGFDGHDQEQVPIHPMVARHFGLQWCPPDLRYRWHHHRWTHDEYIVNYIRWADWAAGG